MKKRLLSLALAFVLGAVFAGGIIFARFLLVPGRGEYHADSVTVLDLREEGMAFWLEFAVPERGKMFDCSGVLTKYKTDKIELTFIKEQCGAFKGPTKIEFANPERLPVYIVGRGGSKLIWQRSTMTMPSS